MSLDAYHKAPCVYLSNALPNPPNKRKTNRNEQENRRHKASILR